MQMIEALVHCETKILKLSYFKCLVTYVGRESSGKYIGGKPQFPVFQCPNNSVKSIIYYLLLTKGETK